MALAFKLMLHKSHRVVIFTGAHLLDARAKARNGQDDDIANLLGCLHSSEVFPGDVALACGHVEIFGVIEEAEDGIGPQRGSGELDDALGVLRS